MKANELRRLAEQLERHVDGQDAELPAGLAQVSTSLLQAMRETQPRPGFLNELAGQLQEQQQAVSRQPRTGGLAHWLWRLLAGTAAAAAVLVFALFVSGLFSQPPLEPAITEQQTALPPVVLRGENGPFAGVEFRLQEPLPAEPERMALYNAEAGPLPETADGVRDLAVDLGMDEPVLYRTGGGWLAEDKAGRKLTIDLTSVRFPIIYRAPDDAPALDATLSWPDRATHAAAFLDDAGLLPAAYETRERPHDSGEGRILVEIIPTLDGHPVHYGASEVVVDSLARVVEARIQPLRFTSTGEVVTAQSGQEAFASVLQSGATMDAFQLDPAGASDKTFYPDLSQAEVGDEVRLLGFVKRLEPVEGGELRVELYQNPSGERAFLLTGRVAVELPGERLVEVMGTLRERLADGRWRIAVAAWQTPPLDNQHMECRPGFLHREAGDLVFLTEDGRTPYKLAYPPAVAGGQRAEVCAIFRYTPQPLPWLSMTVPPLSERMPAVGAMSRASAPEEVEVVEVTRVIVHETGDGPPTPPPDAVGYVTERVEMVDGTVYTETTTVPLSSAVSPFEIGQVVEVSGVVGGFLNVEDERVVPHITLAIDTDDDPTTAPVAYPLSGPWGLLLEISRHYQLHVTIPATIVEAPGEPAGPEGQAIRVGEGGWWRTWPDEKVEVLLGHYEVATLEGREVRFFVDEATGKRYVDATPLYYARPGDSLMSNQPHADDPVWVTAVANPDPQATFGGLPILTVLKQQGGPNLPDRPEAWMLDVTMPLRTSEPTRVPAAGSNTLIIDWAVLGYTYSPGPAGEDTSQTLEPTWLFYGHSSDERTYFVLRVSEDENEPSR